MTRIVIHLTASDTYKMCSLQDQGYGHPHAEIERIVSAYADLHGLLLSNPLWYRNREVIEVEAVRGKP